jgi:hypothetical protein
MHFLTGQDEEFQMLLEVAEEYTRREKEKTAQQKSGNATELVVRNHLAEHRLNVSEPKVKIKGSEIEIDLLALKPKVELKQERDIPIEPSEVSTVIEVKNNAVPRRRNNIPIQPSEVIKERFSQLEKEVGINRYAVVVLSERLLSKTPYKYAITEEKIGKKNCRVFTLVARRKPAKSLYDVDVIKDMLENHELWKTKEWEKCISYLKG